MKLSPIYEEQLLSAKNEAFQEAYQEAFRQEQLILVKEILRCRFGKLDEQSGLLNLFSYCHQKSLYLCY
jgi:hypothetical protein